jgi:sec-independent protein translocase protein TatA
MNVFGVGLPEMAVIAVIALVVFGPRKLPELGRTLGRTLRSFQSASQEFEQEFRKAIDTPPDTVAGGENPPSLPASHDTPDAPGGAG